jgi:hypothetical protein
MSVALELGMDVRDDGQYPENPNLLTDEDGVSSDYQSWNRKSRAYGDQLTIDQ